MKTPMLCLAAMALLAGCDTGSAPPAEQVDDEAELAGDASPAIGGESPVPDTPNARPALDEIPSMIRGRWGLTAADCEPGRDDATGLLTITPNRLEFYESVGTLDGIEEVSGSRIRASFDFTGEGMTWEREILLEVQDDGRTLIRREFGEDAAPEPFRYSKCD